MVHIWRKVVRKGSIKTGKAIETRPGAECRQEKEVAKQGAHDWPDFFEADLD